MSTTPPLSEPQPRDIPRRGAFAVVIFVFALGLLVTASIYFAAGWHEKINAEPITHGQVTVGFVINSHREYGVLGTYVSDVRYRVGPHSYKLLTPPSHQRLAVGAALRVSYNPRAPYQARDLSQVRGAWSSLIKVGVGALLGAILCIAFGVRQLGANRRSIVN